MATLEDVINVELSQLGYKEEPPGSNSTKYGKWWGIDPGAWCAMFQLWCRAEAGLGKLDFAQGASVGFLKQYCQQQGWMIPEPRRGSWVFFEWENDQWPDHIGMVESVNPDGTVNTIEGNSPGPDHTDEVARHVRNRRVARWFAMPSYGTADTPVAPVEPPVVVPVPPVQAPVSTKTNWGAENHPTLQQGSTGQNVVHMQSTIGGVKADGIFGPATKQHLMDCQHVAGIAADGIMGPDSWSHLHHVVRQGMQESAVGEVQRCLGVTADNDFGPQTDHAVRAFQQSVSLAADGVVGPATWRALIS